MLGAAEGIGAHLAEGMKPVDASPPCTFDGSPAFLY
jgi:hypothetical protein